MCLHVWWRRWSIHQTRRPHSQRPPGQHARRPSLTLLPRRRRTPPDGAVEHAQGHLLPPRSASRRGGTLGGGGARRGGGRRGPPRFGRVQHTQGGLLPRSRGSAGAPPAGGSGVHIGSIADRGVQHTKRHLVVVAVQHALGGGAREQGIGLGEVGGRLLRAGKGSREGKASVRGGYTGGARPGQRE